MIVCKNISKVFGAHTKALQNVSINIKEGEYVALVGKSGSGKSTMLNIIGLIDIPTEGEVYLNSKPVCNMKEKEKAKIRNIEIGYVFQSFYLEKAYPVYKNVEMPLLIANVSKKERKKRVEEALEKVGLLHKKNEIAKNLSDGEQQRVSIARALVNNPEIILADEPCGNLDSENTENIMHILEKLNKEGKTIVLVTHSKEEAERARRKITLKDGRIIENEI